MVLLQLRGVAKYLKFKLLQLEDSNADIATPEGLEELPPVADDIIIIVCGGGGGFVLGNCGAVGGTTISSSMVHTRSSMGNLKFISFAWASTLSLVLLLGFSGSEAILS